MYTLQENYHYRYIMLTFHIHAVEFSMSVEIPFDPVIKLLILKTPVILSKLKITTGTIYNRRKDYSVPSILFT